MPMPKCVVLDSLPGPSGYRHIGTRITYRGWVRHQPDPEVRVEYGKNLFQLVEGVDFNGRLWRDSRIDGLVETKKWLEHREAFAIGRYPAAFALFSGVNADGVTLDLLGVHRAATGLGLAERLLRYVGGPITAGTYSDNKAAIKLYKKLNMKEIKREEVFHEN
jgi:ribosomal protein S18 acetylase RimI-like enzyme